MLHYLFDGLPFEGIFFTDDAVGHIDKLMAELLDVVLGVIGGIFKRLCRGVGSERQQLDKRHHVRWLQALLSGVFEGLKGEVQQSRSLGQAAQA